MRRFVHSIALFFFSACAYATHIVGGEFEITHIEGDRYLFRQIQYFDVINGTPEAKDQEINASIFRKADNVFVKSVIMYYQSESYVPYTNPQCTNDRLVTNRIIYTTEVVLNPSLFSDPGGYYMVWERCCRNNIITNIVQPDETGQTFYLEFPPIRKNSEEFRNSSPQLFPPLSDYACVNRFYYVDFRGFDPDGDSLAYSLATPLNTSEYDPLPTPTPAPHPLVTWRAGISSDYQIPGSPTLSVNKKGFLTVTPTEEGLFVFSVKCEEFRDGQKIGEVVRDFQLFVIDCPDPGNKPVIQVKAPGSDTFVSELDTIILKEGDNKCFDFKISDRDGSETISMRAEAVNFEESVQSILSAEVGFLSSPDDTMNVKVCLPDCPYLLNEPFLIDIIARDFTCPLPLMDTIRLAVVVEPPPNKPPQFVAPAQETLHLSYLEGSEISLSFSATDDDQDSLLLSIEGVDFNLEEFGVEIDTVLFEDGRIDYELRWNTDCNIYPFAYKNEFQIKMYVDDYDICQLDNRDSVIVNVKIDLPANNTPVVLVNDSPEDQDLTVHVGDRLQFDVMAFDGDPTDLLSLVGAGVGFELEDLGIVFENQQGNSNVSETMSWSVGCDSYSLLPEGEYKILLIAEDADKCKVPNADTLALTLNVLPPVNHAPEVIINDELSGDTLLVDAGDLVDIEILAFDLDRDSIAVHLLNTDISTGLGITFNGSAGFGNIYSSLVWQTDCSLLNENYGDGIYNVDIVVEDFKCIIPKSDTLSLTFIVHDEEINYDILPPNVFTPNAEDEINESYFIPDLPGDNCRRQFKEVNIFNRYGKEVFRSDEADFHWYGVDQPSGVYYYLISYTDFSLRGTVSLLR
jgi:gliding motility-associated-like protein